MSEPTLSTPCESCGAPLAAGGPAGHCPICLLERTLDETKEEHSVRDEPWTSFGGHDLYEEIGRGGMGVVYRARQRALGRVVAVKVLLDSGFASAAQKERFRREAEAVAKLKHPAIVAIHETGESDGLPWFSMDYLEGPGLEQRVRHAPPTGRESATLLREIADAVTHAHSRGILHRDLKPSNVLLDASGRPHITDFGIAANQVGRNTSDPALTRTGQSLGSPGYAAPELVQGGKADERSDVYGLGAILYHLLTGRPPYQGTTLESILRQIREDDPVLPSRLVPGVSRDLETIAMKCLRKDPRHRYESTAELGEDLTRWLEGAPVKARPLGPVKRAARWCRRRRALATLIAAGVSLGCVTVGGVLAYAKRQGELERRAGLLAEARRFNSSTDAGARGVAIAALREAWQIAPSAEIRSEAIAALSRPDWVRLPAAKADPSNEAFDDPLVSGDGSRRIRFSGESIAVIDAATDRIKCSFDGYSRGTIASLDDTGSRLALAGPGEGLVKILSIPEGEILAKLEHSEQVTGLDWSGELIATGCANRFIHIWDPRGRLRHRFVGHESARLTVHFRPGGTELASVSEDPIVRLWHAGRGVELLSAYGKGWNGRSAAWNREGTCFFFSSHDGSRRHGLELLGSAHVRVLTLPEDLPGPEGLATMDLSPSGDLVSTSDDGACHLRDAATGRILARIPKGEKEWVVTRFSPDGSSLWLSGWDRGCTPYPIVRENGEIRLGEPGEPHFGSGNLLRAISRDGELFVLGNNAIEAFVIASRSGGKPVYLKQRAVLSAAISPDGLLVATSSYASSGVVVWRLPGGQTAVELPAPGTSAEFWFSPDGGSLTVCASEGALRYRTRDWSLEPSFPQGKVLEGAVPLSDLGVIACRDGDSVVLRDASTLEVRQRMPLPALAGWLGRAKLAGSRDGTKLAVQTASGPVIWWDLSGLETELAKLGFGPALE